MGDRREDRDPPKAKRLSLTRDGRNSYGENDKAARKTIPRFKRASVRAERRDVVAMLAGRAGPVGDVDKVVGDRADRALAEAAFRGAHPKTTRVPDSRLGDVIAHRLEMHTRRTGRKQGWKARIAQAAAATAQKVDET
jgi:hypothetical protein